MSFTVRELEDAFNETDYYWDDIDEDAEIDLKGFGKLEFVEDFGGEGQGDTMWVVFKVQDRYFRKTAYYDSWNGASWDSSLEEVEPKEKVITVYEVIK